MKIFLTFNLKDELFLYSEKLGCNCINITTSYFETKLY